MRRLKTNKMSPNEEEQLEICKHFEKKVDAGNAPFYFRISRHFNLPRLSKLALLLIESCFPTVAGSRNFLELDLACVKEILLSSELRVDSEVQVLEAAEAWLAHKPAERGKHARTILQCVRLHLLSVATLNFILNKNSFFSTNDECVSLIKKVLKEKSCSRLDKQKIEGRWCNQSNFCILLCGGSDYRLGSVDATRDVRMIEPNNPFAVTTLPPLIEERYLRKAVACVNREIYVFGGIDNEDALMTSVEKYSFAANAWSVVADMKEKLRGFCVTSFMGSIYIVGGDNEDRDESNSCTEFNTKSLDFRKVSSTNKPRVFSACAVFEGGIVVCGGRKRDITNTVEVYDHVDDSWTYLPAMNEGRYLHSLVVGQNRLFVIGGSFQSNEVYDSDCKKFVMLGSPPGFENFLITVVDAVSCGNKILFFFENSVIFVVLDFETREWSREYCGVLGGLDRFSCTKVPLLSL